MREYGYSIKRTPATCKSPRYNAVAAISTESIVAIRIF